MRYISQCISQRWGSTVEAYIGTELRPNVSLSTEHGSIKNAFTHKFYGQVVKLGCIHSPLRILCSLYCCIYYTICNIRCITFAFELLRLLNIVYNLYIYLLIIHTKLTIEGNAQNILTTQHNIKAKALNATRGSKLNC